MDTVMPLEGMLWAVGVILPLAVRGRIAIRILPGPHTNRLVNRRIVDCEAGVRLNLADRGALLRRSGCFTAGTIGRDGVVQRDVGSVIDRDVRIERLRGVIR